jgi:predicted transcriptional regulator
MKKLTKAEEEIMLILWRLNEALVRDIIPELSDRETAYTTVSTVLRVLEKKKFISHKAYGTTYLYFPLVSKQEYSRAHLKDFVANYFNGSFSSMATFFAGGNDLSIEEMQELLTKLQNELIKKSQNG